MDPPWAGRSPTAGLQKEPAVGILHRSLHFLYGDRIFYLRCGSHPSLPVLRVLVTRLPSVSAICTAFSAAPLRRLSDTHHRFRPLSIVLSWRMRLMKVA